MQKARTTAVSFLKPLAIHVILWNAVIWLLLINRYSALNLPARAPIPPGDALDDIWIVLAYVVYAGMVFAVWRVVSGILEKSPSPFLTRCYLAGTSVLVVLYGFKWLVPEKGFWWKVHFEVYDSAILVFFILEIGLLVFLWRKSAGAADAVMARLGKAFAVLYLARFPLLPFLIVVPSLVRAFVGMLLINAVPVIWLRVFFRAYEERRERAAAGPLAAGEAELEAVCRSSDLSKRERDILVLILAGKSNHDIERELFISYHTVKNHVYHIFQKLGVRNRFELARLVENRAREARERPGEAPKP
jgi:DNA-binding CsgD family transcriptional regulator